MLRQFKTEAGIPAVMGTDPLPVAPHLCLMRSPVETNKNAFSLQFLRNAEKTHITADRLINILVKSVKWQHTVCMRQADLLHRLVSLLTGDRDQGIVPLRRKIPVIIKCRSLHTILPE